MMMLHIPDVLTKPLQLLGLAHSVYQDVGGLHRLGKSRHQSVHHDDLSVLLAHGKRRLSHVLRRLGKASLDHFRAHYVAEGEHCQAARGGALGDYALARSGRSTQHYHAARHGLRACHSAKTLAGVRLATDPFRVLVLQEGGNPDFLVLGVEKRHELGALGQHPLRERQIERRADGALGDLDRVR